MTLVSLLCAVLAHAHWAPKHYDMAILLSIFGMVSFGLAAITAYESLTDRL